jgi:hypothetical protein
MTSGSAFSCFDLTWMKWMSTPSISVVNCGTAFRRCATRPKSYSFAQYFASAFIAASWTPLRAVVDQLLGRPARLGDAPAEVVEVLLLELDLKGTDVGGGLDGGHQIPPLWIGQSDGTLCATGVTKW